MNCLYVFILFVFIMLIVLFVCFVCLHLWRHLTCGQEGHLVFTHLLGCGCGQEGHLVASMCLFEFVC